MSELPAILNEPVVWVFGALAVVGMAVGALQLARRKRAWIVEAENLGFTYFNEDGKRGRGGGAAAPAEIELVKSFTLRCLQGGYHQHVLTGRWQGQSVLIADYEQKKFPEALHVDARRSSTASTYRRTVFARRLTKGALPSAMLCRGRSHADALEWIDDEQRVAFPDDPEFERVFTVVAPDAEAVRARLSEALRKMLLDKTKTGFHLEFGGRDVAVHEGKYLAPGEAKDTLALLTEIAAHLAR